MATQLVGSDLTSTKGIKGAKITKDDKKNKRVFALSKTGDQLFVLSYLSLLGDRPVVGDIISSVSLKKGSLVLNFDAVGASGSSKTQFPGLK